MVNEGRFDSGSPEDRLTALFAAYRDACPDVDGGAGFMPRLWQNIDARQTYGFTLKRFAQGVITAAAAISLAMGIYLTHIQPRISTPYLETLAASQHDSLADTEIVAALHENSR